MRVNPSHFSPNLNFNNLQRIKIMQKLIKVNKTELDKMVLSENKDLNLIFFSVRTLKMQIEQLEKMLENQGIGYYGTDYRQVTLKDYMLDENDDLVVKSQKRDY